MDRVVNDPDNQTFLGFHGALLCIWQGGGMLRLFRYLCIRVALVYFHLNNLEVCRQGKGTTRYPGSEKKIPVD